MVGLGGAELTGLERAWLRLVRPGGVILFKRNIVDATQTRALLDEATGLGAPHAVRCVDVEGGTVNRLRDALAPLPSAQAVGAVVKKTKKADMGARARRTDCPRREGIRVQYDAGAGGRSGVARIDGSAGVAAAGRRCCGRGDVCACFP